MPAAVKLLTITSATGRKTLVETAKPLVEGSSSPRVQNLIILNSSLAVAPRVATSSLRTTELVVVSVISYH